MGETYGNKWDFYIGGTNSSNFKEFINSGTSYIISVSNTNLIATTFEGTEIYNSSYNMGTWNTGLNINLFGRRKTNTTNENSAGGSFKIYYCKIYDNNELVRDLVPGIRKSDNVICMYDKVTGTFFENAGTGEFIAGPEI